jgi:phosphoribosylformylglycinamidine cyclo-ligase
MRSETKATYKSAGVDTERALQALKSLLVWTNKTLSYSQSPVCDKVPRGFFANVLKLTEELGLVLCTDGVGSKILVAEMMNSYDTIGIDCVAMNVNDLICVGGRPLAMLDYIAIKGANKEQIEAIGKGLHEGARQARISIVGGEIAQIPEMILGIDESTGVDLVGMAVGMVKLNRLVVGQAVRPGDAIIGIRSSGIHCNGLSLARNILLRKRGYKIDQRVNELGTTLGEELLKPTIIYVPHVMDLLESRVRVKALMNITSDGFLNLSRIDPKIGFVIDDEFEPQPIFDLIQKEGNVSTEEMFSVFNMGTGFCVIVDRDDASAALSVLAKHGDDAKVIGHTIEDSTKAVYVRSQGLRGIDNQFLREGAPTGQL